MRPLFSLAVMLTMTLTAAVATAEPAVRKAAVAAQPSQKAPAKKEKAEGKAKGAMPLDKLQKEVETRIVKAREQIEAQVASKRVTSAKAKELKAKIDAGAAQLKSKLSSIGHDGVVTAVELREVRELVGKLLTNSARPATASKPAKKK